MKPRVSATSALAWVASMLVIATGVVLGLVPSETFAQSSGVISLRARVIAPCTISSDNPRSSCSEQTLALQSGVKNASARISTIGTQVVITHRGGLTPTIRNGMNQVSVSF